MGLPARQFLEDGLELGHLGRGDRGVGLAHATVEDGGATCRDMIDGPIDPGNGFGVLPLPLLERVRDGLIEFATR